MSGRLLLLGGGHTHLAALERLRALQPRRHVSLLAPSRRLLYSGMMPGWMAGQYRFEDCAIDLRAHCERLGVEWIEAEAIDIRFDQRCVIDARGGGHDYSELSINVGSAIPLPPGTGDPIGVVGAKPFALFTETWEAWLAALERAPGARSLVVVGAGAAGVELAFALASRAAREASLAGSTVLLCTAGAGVLEGQSRIGAWLAARSLQRAGVKVLAGHRLVGREHGALVFETAGGRKRVEYGFALLATGAEPPAWLGAAARRHGVAVAPDGGIAVDSRLRSVSSDGVWASGDCASFVDQRVPRSGVHALRQGPALAESIARGSDAAPYRAQRRALALLNRCDGSAIAIRGPLAAAGAWAWRWKDDIDRRFIARFRSGGQASAGRG
ncbi:FAD-dependent oxidoreductase [Burkholderiaceae bacterium FT117]|uniref:FAD-dependent oxidoreductase n=1 Tax=Zeimonas sediminis TaxID=2944268 RepID=UPI002342E9DD|nr:FAD-dependent oxidoreductase [Zeimonas sediminis]MCM5569083.1 FAD-dependent oxidoreductase [Zeimonas sediminis]